MENSNTTAFFFFFDTVKVYVVLNFKVRKNVA